MPNLYNDQNTQSFGLKQETENGVQSSCKLGCTHSNINVIKLALRISC